MEHDDLPTLELAFPGPERDRGVAAILSGEKTALTGLLEIFEHAGEAVPRAGRRFSVLDSEGRPAVTIELVDVRVVPMKEIDDDFARAEGRGYRDAAQWRAAHEEFFRSDGVSELLGRTPVVDDDTLVVAERFRVVELDDPGLTVVTRLVTHVDLDDGPTDTRRLSVSARLAAVLADGRELVLLDDRGWSSTAHGRGVDIRASTSVEDIERTARTVVGPDEPMDGETQEQMAAAHWSALAGLLGRQGVEVDAPELERLPHDVQLSERLRAWLA